MALALFITRGRRKTEWRDHEVLLSKRERLNPPRNEIMANGVFKDTMKMAAAYGLAQMIFGILIILCLGMIIGGIFAIKKADTTTNEDQKDLWLTLGWSTITIGAVPLVLLMIPQLLIGFGRGAGWIFANMAIEELF